MNGTDHYFSDKVEFSWIEYCTFSALLGCSLMIGIYYGCIKKNQNTTFEYLLGGKEMSVLPVAISLITSHVSGVTLLGVPAETYEYGTQFIMICLGFCLASYVTNKLFIPVFYSLQLTSLYEYLELRFSKSVRISASIVYALNVILHTPVVIYIPCLAFHQMTGISVHNFAPIICLVCVFYTTIGGLKTVVWTDAFQAIFTLGSVIAVIVLGLIDAGGIEKVIEINKSGQRLEFFKFFKNRYYEYVFRITLVSIYGFTYIFVLYAFTVGGHEWLKKYGFISDEFNTMTKERILRKIMNPDPLARTTFWTITLGGFCLSLASIAIHPGSVQRFISLPTMRKAERSSTIYGIGSCFSKTLTVFIGLIIYAKYNSCDPLKSGRLKRSGELIPYYVQKTSSQFSVRVLNGIFISGLLSAALSTMSANLNTVAGTLYEDFFSTRISEKSKNTKANFIMKMTVVCVGCVCILMVFVVEHMGAILQVAISMHGFTVGPILSVFILGILCPRVSKKGAICGMIVSFLSMSWIIVNAQVAIYRHELQFETKPTSIANCSQTFPSNHTGINSSHRKIAEGVYAHEDLFPLYAISYFYYPVLGTVIGVVIGILVSWVSSTSEEEIEKLHPSLITPMMRRYLPEKKTTTRKYDSKREYKEVAQEMDNIYGLDGYEHSKDNEKI